MQEVWLFKDDTCQYYQQGMLSGQIQQITEMILAFYSKFYSVYVVATC